MAEILDKAEMTDPDPPAFQQMADKMKDLMKPFQKDPVVDAKLDPPVDAAPAPAKSKEALKATPEPKKADPVVPDIAEEKKLPEVKPEEEPIPASIKTPKAHEEFKALRVERDQWKAKVSKAEDMIKQADAELAKMREASKTVQIPESVKTELENTKKELEEYRTRLRQTDLEKDPQFENYFTGKLTHEMTQIKELAPAKFEDIQKLAMLPDSAYKTQALLEIYGEMDEITKDDIKTAVRNIRGINSERVQALSQHGEHLKQMQAQRAAQTEAQQKEASQKIAATKTAELAKAREHLSSFKPVEGDEAHNASIKEREAIVDAFFDGKLPPDQLGKIPIWAAHGMYLQKTTVPALTEQVRRLTEQLKSYQAASPAVNGSGGKVATPAKDPSKMTFEERYRHALNS